MSDPRPKLLTPAASMAAASALALGLLIRPSDLPALPLCLFRSLTTLPCPGCGLTRSFCAILHGDFLAACSFNPFGYLFVAAAIFVLAAPLMIRIVPDLESRIFRPSVSLYVSMAVVAAMFLYNLARISRILG